MTKNSEKFTSGCMVCGTELVYKQEPELLSCYYCDNEFSTSAQCINNHFVCDSCHTQDAIGIIKSVCLSSTEKDMIVLLKKIRSHEKFPMHGPEHHAMVSGIILTAYRNSGGNISDTKIVKCIERGAKIPGGYCGFIGACGAAMGVGNAFGLILESTPLKPQQRHDILNVTSKVLCEIAKNKAARCCQRESLIALQQAAKLSEDYIGIKLQADAEFKCTQFDKNKECLEAKCPFWFDDGN
ncbi:DUF5714 domain-containing protein [[Eubacterium] cellulosolvens]